MNQYNGQSANARVLTAVRAIALLGCCMASMGLAQEIDFLERQQQTKDRFEKRRDQPKSKLVHDPPMIEATKSPLSDNDAVIGVSLNGEARAYPLTMLFGGGGIFELLNDTCGDQPIAVSW